MPPKRGKTSAKRGAAVVQGEDGEETFNVDGLIESGSAATPSPSTLSRRGGGKKKQQQQTAPARQITRTETEGAAASGTYDAEAEEKRDDYDDAQDSLAATTLQALLDGAAVSSIVDTILNVFRGGDHSTAMCGVLNVLVKASGVAAVELDHNALLEGVDIAPLLEELYARVAEDSAAYLLVNKESRNKRFRLAFPQFCERLVQLAFSGDVLLEVDFLPVLAQWIIAMCESKARSFRHTATVAVLSLVQGLNRLVADLQARLVLIERKKEATKVQQTLNDIAEWRDHLFSQAVHQRLRDIAPEIRLACFQRLKEWMLEFPKEFLANKYLRYFSMPLSDKRPELRAEALDMVLQTLAHVPDAYAQMNLFLKYTADRIVEVSSDVDIRCTELAIRVVAMMVSRESEAAVVEEAQLISSERIDRVLLALFDERPTIRAAAGILLKVFIDSRTFSEESEAEQVKVATELLCLFARTLRESYMEEMPEKYLVDALWSPERPPLILTQYAPLVKAAKSSASLDCVVGLNLIAAILDKVQGKLTLGPLPKDDRRQANKKPSAATQDAISTLREDLSTAAGNVLSSVLERHRDDIMVLRAAANVVAVLDLSVFASQKETALLSALLVELRKATMTTALGPIRAGGITGEEGEEEEENGMSVDGAKTRDVLVRAWYTLAFSEHSIVSEAQGHLQQMLTLTLKQLTGAMDKVNARKTGAEWELLQAWRRFHLISALVPIDEQWGLIRGSLEQHAKARAASTAPEMLSHMLGTAVNSVLWRLNDAAAKRTDDGESSSEENEDIRTHMAELVASLLQTLDAIIVESIGSHDSAASSSSSSSLPPTLRLRCDALVYLADIAALRHHNMPQSEQESFLYHFELTCESLFPRLTAAQEAHKALLFASAPLSTAEPAVLASVAASRRRLASVESLCMRVTSGTARLFLFKRLIDSLAPRVLVWWTQASSKPVADVFKGLFHALRERSGDSFGLERDVLVEGYGQCAKVGATPASVDALYQLGSKLASLHFTGTDRYHSTVVSVVLFGIQFASSTDPLLLQGVTPYCGKLHQQDALRLIRGELPSYELFTAASNPYVRAFISSIRRAAKLDDDSNSSSAAVGTAAKRSRELTISSTLEEDGLLAAIAQSTPHQQQQQRGGANSRISMATRVVTDDGWRVPVDFDGFSAGTADSTPVPSQQSQPGVSGRSGAAARRNVVNLPSTQETATPSTPAELDNEVFIATQEFE